MTQVTSSYLSTPLVQAVPWRQSELQRKYHFFCQCAACGGGWTPAAQLPRALADTPPERFKFALDDVRRMQAQFAKVVVMNTAKSVRRNMLSLTF